LLLTVDIGNTNIVLGVYRGEELVAHWRLATMPQKSVDEYGIQIKSIMINDRIDPLEINGFIISCVVPALQGTFEEISKRYFNINPLIVGPGIKTGMSILYDNPREVGADRIVNSVAAFTKYKQALIIVDFGTATTFDCVNTKGEYMGGVIAPGVQISAEALFLNASKLPRVEIIKPKTVLGKNTIHSMQSGCVYGYVGLVDGIVQRLRVEMNCPVKVLATGGLASLIAEDSTAIESVEPFLTLEGLRILFSMNQKG